MTHTAPSSDSDPTPRCLINLAHLDPPNNGGVSRLAREVSVALASQPPSMLRSVFFVKSRFLSQFRDWLGVRQNIIAIPYFYRLSFSLHLVLRIVRPNIIVSPLFGVEPFISTDSIPHVTGIPDALPLDHPELFSPTQLLWRQQTYQRASLAQAVVTLSEHSRSRLTDHFPGLSERLHIIALGADSPSQPGEQLLVEPPYIFYPANTWLHKRHELLLQAMAIIWQSKPDLKLVLSGGRPPHVDLKGLIARYAPPERVIDVGYVTESQLTALYAGAEAMLYTSEYEGFGMPLLEAMHAGCPVVCAPLSAIPEVAGDAALYVASDTPEGWADAFLNQLPGMRQVLTARGRERARQFTWAQTRAKWIEVILETVRAAQASHVAK
jgi:glycosyltransferase involved in cell wall biosynthesis